MFEKILVPLDGSELSESALPYAEELAAAFGSELELANVCELPESISPRHQHQAYIDGVAEGTRKNLLDYRGLGNRSAVSIKTVILHGEPAAEIIKYAEQHNINLIVMASHGRSGIMPWAMGTTAMRVAQGATKPVLFVKASTAGAQKKRGEIFSKILVPLDGSKTSETSLPYVTEIAQKLTTKITLLQVVEPGQWVHSIGGLTYVPFPERQMDIFESEAKQYLEETGKKFAGTKAGVAYEVRIGQAADTIIRLADETATGLVAMSTHGRSGISRWFFGSVANKVMQAGHTPLLLIRAREGK
ncbi:MAG: universal stress protein, partial [Chloroflexi bacterium]|nr:universal stress protein [Chloroflexota bacterium]